MVNRDFVREFGKSVGDVVELHMYAKDQSDEVSNGIYEPHGPVYRFPIVGVVRTPQDIGTDEVHNIGHVGHLSANEIALSDHWYESHRDAFLNFGGQYSLQLTEPPPSRKALASSIAATSPDAATRPILIPTEDQTHPASLTTPVRVETTALYALGIGLALAVAIATALILRTEQRIHENDTPVLQWLGCSARQLGAAAMLRTVPVAVAGAVLAAVTALLLSPRYPIGIGRQLERDPGFAVNVAVLGVGVLAVIVFVLGAAFLFGYPRRRREAGAHRHSATAAWLAGAGAPVELTLGAYLGFARGRNVRPVPARPALVGGTLLVAVMTGLALYGVGVDHAYGTRAGHGWRWDAAIGNVNFPLQHSTAAALAQDRHIRAQTAVGYGQVKVGGVSTEVLAYDPRGTAPPEVTSGRLPRAPDEIALGAATLDRLGLHIGSRVPLNLTRGEFDTGETKKPRELTVVGTALSPVFGEEDVGSVGIVTLGAIHAGGGNAEPRIVLVDLRTGQDPAGIRAFDHRYTEEMMADFVPAQVVNLHRVQSVVEIGFALLALLVFLLVGYVVAVTIRARSRDLAIMRALGLRARQAGTTLFAESGMVAVLIVIVGIPLGVLFGKALWTRVTSSIGLSYDASILPVVVAVALLTLLAPLVATAWPARRARRAHVMEILHAY
jgi:hypothetical protein